MKAELVVDAQATLGEGSLWDSQRECLWWVDILGSEVHCFDPLKNTDHMTKTGEPVGTVVPRTSGDLAVALQSGIYALDFDSGRLALLVDPEPGFPDNRFNDGKCDPAGRFWAGTCSFNCDVPKAGGLYKIEQDLSVTKMLGELTISNGLVWTSDAETFYFIDSPTQQVWGFDYDLVTGQISNKRIAVEIPPEEGLPDGMTIDADDHLWVCLFGGGKVVHYDPVSGNKEGEITVPAKRVTSCAFSGEHLDQLYITTATVGLDKQSLQEQPGAGGLFLATPGSRGVSAAYFNC